LNYTHLYPEKREVLLSRPIVSGIRRQHGFSTPMPPSSLSGTFWDMGRLPRHKGTAGYRIWRCKGTTARLSRSLCNV